MPAMIGAGSYRRSGKLNLFNDRVRAEKLYDTVTELAEPLGNMRLPQTTKAIDEAIAKANADVLPSPEVKREVLGALNRVRAEISPTESARPSMGVRDPVTGTLRAQPMTPTTSVPDTTYGRMRGLRSSLGDLQREAAGASRGTVSGRGQKCAGRGHARLCHAEQRPPTDESGDGC